MPWTTPIYSATTYGVGEDNPADPYDLTIQQAAQHVSDDVLGERLVEADLWSALVSLRGDPLLGGKLQPLHEHVSRKLGRDVSLEQLRFARVCLV